MDQNPIPAQNTPQIPAQPVQPSANPQPGVQQAPPAPQTPPKPKKKKAFFFAIVGVIIIIGLTALSTMFFIKSSQKKEASQKTATLLPTKAPSKAGTISITPSTTSPIEKIKTAITQDKTLSPLVVTTPESYELSRFLWVSGDNWTISVASPEGVVLHVPTTQEALANPADKTSQSKQFHALISSVLTQNGFTQNMQNSSTSDEDNQFYDYIQAYENTNFLCTALTDPDGSSFGTATTIMRIVKVLCAPKTSYQRAYAEQLPFLKALGDHKAILDNIQIKDGDKMTADISGRRSGAILFMYNDNGTWKKIAEQQGFGQCSDLVNANIPQKYWIDCLDNTGAIKKGSF